MTNEQRAKIIVGYLASKPINYADVLDVLADHFDEVRAETLEEAAKHIDYVLYDSDFGPPGYRTDLGDMIRGLKEKG